MLTIKDLSGTSINEVHRAFKNAFADYAEPFDKTEEELQYMIERRGYDPARSFGAFKDGELVCFTLNGVGAWNGKATAYDTGTVKAYRQQGLASKVFEATAAALHHQGITQYLLEVLRVNIAAIDLYKKMGFNVVREFDYYITSTDGLDAGMFNIPLHYEIRNIDHPNWADLSSFWDIQPGWQNSIDSIKRKMDYFRIAGMYEGDKLVGYGIIEPSTGDIPQLAVSKEYRRQGIGNTIFNHLISLNESIVLKIINVEANYIPFKNFMSKKCIAPGHGQYEMMCSL